MGPPFLYNPLKRFPVCSGMATHELQSKLLKGDYTGESYKGYELLRGLLLLGVSITTHMKEGRLGGKTFS